jgi:two-component system, LytTR family, response regulator
MLRAIVIDDEDHSRDTIRKLLGEYCPEVQVVGAAGDIESGRRAILQYNPDLVFLDVQLEDGTGFDLLRSFSNIQFRTIFITAFDKYAQQAFRFSAIDYLLKPVDPEELAAAVHRAEEFINHHVSLQFQALEANLKSVLVQKKKIILKTFEKIHLVDLDQIVSCESADNYTIIQTMDGERILVSRTLKDYDEMLSDCGFYRVHKSFLVNLAHVKCFEKQDGGFVILSNSQKVPVASRKRDELLAVFDKMGK